MNVFLKYTSQFIDNKQVTNTRTLGRWMKEK